MSKADISAAAGPPARLATRGPWSVLGSSALSAVGSDMSASSSGSDPAPHHDGPGAATALTPLGSAPPHGARIRSHDGAEAGVAEGERAVRDGASADDFESFGSHAAASRP